MTGRRGRWT